MTSLLNYRKVLLSAVMIAFVVSLVFAGTTAFFSDEETSTGNTFTAGAIDLKIDNSSYGFDWNRPGEEEPTGEWGPNEANSWQLADLDDCLVDDEETCLFFSFIDLKPGDYGEDTISLHVNDNDSWACMAFNLTGTPENGQNEPEENVDPTAGADEGELQNYLSFLFWNDDGDNVLETGEDVIEDLSGLPGEIFSGDWLAIADSQDEGLPLPGDTTQYIGKGWCFGEITQAPVQQDNASNTPPSAPGRIGFTCSGAGDHNDAQTDGIVVDVSFYAEQSRNNGDFLCSELPPLDGGERQLVGAEAVTYVAPTSTCSITVSGDQSIQTAVSGAAENSTVCVDGAYTGAGDNTAIRIETLGLTLAATPQGVNLDVPVVLSNSNVTVTGFDGVIGQAESPAEQAAFYLDNDADGAEVSYNTVTGGVGAAVMTETGAALAGGLIANNVLSGATQGIYLNPHTGTIVIEYNDIDDNAAGIAGLNGATVRFNEFEHTTPGSEAIGIDGSFDDNGATVNFNNFLDDMFINAYDATVFGNIDNTVDAENNFFSTSGATQTNDPIIDFTPEEGSAFPHN